MWRLIKWQTEVLPSLSVDKGSSRIHDARCLPTWDTVLSDPFSASSNLHWTTKVLFFLAYHVYLGYGMDFFFFFLSMTITTVSSHQASTGFSSKPPPPFRNLHIQVYSHWYLRHTLGSSKKSLSIFFFDRSSRVVWLYRCPWQIPISGLKGHYILVANIPIFNVYLGYSLGSP